MGRVSASSSHSSFSRKVVVKPGSFGIPVAENLAARTWGLAANVAAIRGPGAKFVPVLSRLKRSVPALFSNDRRSYSAK
jgi:hypothetical protein